MPFPSAVIFPLQISNYIRPSTSPSCCLLALNQTTTNYLAYESHAYALSRRPDYNHSETWFGDLWLHTTINQLGSLNELKASAKSPVFRPGRSCFAPLLIIRAVATNVSSLYWSPAIPQSLALLICSWVVRTPKINRANSLQQAAYIQKFITVCRADCRINCRIFAGSQGCQIIPEAAGLQACRIIFKTSCISR